MTNDIKDWLLKSDPWTEYRTRIDILDQQPDSPEVADAYNRMTKHPIVDSIINDLLNWPGKVLNSHKSAGQSYHKLSFISDLGFDKTNIKIRMIIDKVTAHKSDEGIFQLPANIPVHYGGSGQDQYAWALCDAPTIIYSLAKLGLKNDVNILKAKDYLKNLARDNGYPCIVSKELGKFRGPGRKDDPCPYATMIMLKLLGLYESERVSDYANKSVLSLLYLWEKSTKVHPYMFYMGTDFRKLKAPFIWYDIVHFADILSNFDSGLKDKRFQEILRFIESKATFDGKYIPESEWKAWKNWDFGQKKHPSSWLTFLIYRLRKRSETRNK